MTILKRFAPHILLAGDVLSLLIFTYIGERDHELLDGENPLFRLLLVTFAFALPWVVAGWVLGAFPRGEALTARSLLLRSVNTWLVAVPLGVLVRAYLLGLQVIVRSFVVAGLVFIGLFLLGWRLAFVLIWLWLERRAREPKPA